MRNDGSTGAPDAWSVYLASEDAPGTAQATLAHGGEVFVDAMEVRELGSMAVLADPGGASIGVWQPGTHPGFEVWNETGAPCWFELHSREYDATVSFYWQVFHWDTHTMSDTPDFRYTTLGEGDDALAGIMDAASFLPDDAPAHWAIYFGVESAEAALEQIEQLGGMTIEPAMDSPYGRLAVAADPTGTRFRLVQG